MADPLQVAQYYDYSYHEIGMDDVPVFVDTIIAARPLACNKVTLVPHSTAVNAAVVAASRIPSLGAKVGSIVGLAPCLRVNASEMFINLNDKPSFSAIYNFMMDAGITNLFGPDHEANLATMCGGGIGQYICN